MSNIYMHSRSTHETPYIRTQTANRSRYSRLEASSSITSEQSHLSLKNRRSGGNWEPAWEAAGEAAGEASCIFVNNTLTSKFCSITYGTQKGKQWASGVQLGTQMATQSGIQKEVR